jgi:hypothetical protein
MDKAVDQLYILSSLFIVTLCSTVYSILYSKNRSTGQIISRTFAIHLYFSVLLFDAVSPAAWHAAQVRIAKAQHRWGSSGPLHYHVLALLNGLRLTEDRPGEAHRGQRQQNQKKGHISHVDSGVFIRLLLL